MTLLIPATLDLDLPAIRPTALELIHALSREETELAEIAAIVRLDPVLTARVLAYANSPFLAALRPIVDIGEAIVRIGRNEFRKVFYFSVLQDAFSQHAPQHEALLRRLWTQTLAISVAVEQLQMEFGQHFRLTEEEFAVLSPLAILHGIGFLVLLHNFPSAFEGIFIPPPATMPELILRQHERCGGWDHAVAGAALLRAWYFPELAARCTQTLLTPPPSGDHLALLLRLGTYLAIQAGLTLFPDVPADFWIQPLPANLDPTSLLDLVPTITSTVELYSGIWE